MKILFISNLISNRERFYNRDLFKILVHLQVNTLQFKIRRNIDYIIYNVEKYSRFLLKKCDLILERNKTTYICNLAIRYWMLHEWMFLRLMRNGGNSTCFGVLWFRNYWPSWSISDSTSRGVYFEIWELIGRRLRETTSRNAASTNDK